MATLPGLRVGLTLDSATFVAETRRVGAAVGRMGGDVSKQTHLIEGGFGRLNSAIGVAKSALIGFGAAIGVTGLVSLGKQIVATSDEYAKMTGRLRLAIGETGNLAAVQQNLLTVAQATRQDLSVTSELFTKLAMSMRDSGKSAGELLGITETLAQAVSISGASTSAAAAGLLQFSQGMSSGVLRGEELNSIMEQIPRLASAIADGMDMPIGKLRELGKEGALTTEIVLAALQSQAPQLAAEFAKVPITVEDAMTKVRNSFTVLVGGTDQATGSTRALAEALSQLADTLATSEVREGFLSFIAEGVKRISESITEVQRIIQGIRNLAQAFVDLKDDTIESVDSMVSGIEDALGRRMKDVLLSSALPTVSVALQFKEMYDAVVGQSYVPDMVDGIESEFKRLQRIMVPPAEKAAAEVDKIFGNMSTGTVAHLTAINDEEGGRRLGQLTAGGNSAPWERNFPTEAELSAPFKNALKSVQSEFTNTFDEISQGTVRSFEDMASSIHGIFTNMSSNLLSLAIFDQKAFAKISADTGVSQGVLGGAAAATPLIGLASGLFGNKGSQQGITYGGAGGAAIGGLAGAFFGPAGIAAGSLAGGLLGSVGGGILGGFLGGNDKDKSKGSVSGSLGNLSNRGEKLGEITDALRQFDDSILQLLTKRQKDLVNASLKARKSAVEVNFKGELTEDVIRSATGQRARAIGTGLGFRNIQNAEDIGAALQTQRAIEELTNSTALFARQIEETSAQFVELRSQGRQFGISIEGLAEAQTKAVADLRKAQDAQIAALLDPFKALLAPLDAFKSRLDFTGLNPAEQFARAQADFQRISAEAAAGSIPAIQQFESAADLFVQLANQVGASPGQAAAVSQVEAALSEIRDSITKAQADASRGVEDILDRADKNNTVRLDQLIELIQEQIRIQKKGGAKI